MNLTNPMICIYRTHIYVSTNRTTVYFEIKITFLEFSFCFFNKNVTRYGLNGKMYIHLIILVINSYTKKNYHATLVFEV